MADNRKYYYLKLKENYFDDDVVVVLESMPDGILYSNLLLKLYLKSLKHGGRLQLDENIPYTAQMIATITHHQIGTVERALNIFLKLGLMERVPDGSFYMNNIELMIGKSSTEGERKKQARLALKAKSGQLSGHLSDTRPPEIEIKKEIEPESERETEAGLLHFLGRFRNVLLSDEDILILQRELPGSWSEYIERLSEYMKSSGKTYQSHLATILRWAKEDAQKKLCAAQRNYSVKESDVV